MVLFSLLFFSTSQLQARAADVSDTVDEPDALPATAVAAGPAQPVVAEKPQRFRHFYGSVDLGVAWTTGLKSIWGDRVGGSFGLDFGYQPFELLSVGVGYQLAVASPTFILFGGTASASVLSFNTNLTLVRTKHFRLLAGGRVSSVNISGSDTVFFIPLNSYSEDTVGVGPELSFLFDLNKLIYLGARIQYQWLFAADATYVSFSGNSQKSRVPGFGYSSVESTFGLRF